MCGEGSAPGQDGVRPPQIRRSKVIEDVVCKKLTMFAHAKNIAFSEEIPRKNSNHSPTRIFAQVGSGNSLPTSNLVEKYPFVQE